AGDGLRSEGADPFDEAPEHGSGGRQRHLLFQDEQDEGGEAGWTVPEGGAACSLDDPGQGGVGVGEGGCRFPEAGPVQAHHAGAFRYRTQATYMPSMGSAPNVLESARVRCVASERSQTWPGGIRLSSPSTVTVSPAMATILFTSQKSSRWGCWKTAMSPRDGCRRRPARIQSPGISAGAIDISETMNRLMFQDSVEGVWSVLELSQEVECSAHLRSPMLTAISTAAS